MLELKPEVCKRSMTLKLPSDVAQRFDQFVEFVTAREGRGDRDAVVHAILREELKSSRAEIWRQFRQWRGEDEEPTSQKGSSDQEAEAENDEGTREVDGGKSEKANGKGNEEPAEKSTSRSRTSPTDASKIERSKGSRSVETRRSVKRED